MESSPVREIFTDAIKYWEPRRLIYNTVLAGITIARFAYTLPNSKSDLNWGLAIGLFVLAAIANLLYCAAYVVDVFVQLSGFRDAWRRLRWVLFVFGILLATALSIPFVLNIFPNAPPPNV